MLAPARLKHRKWQRTNKIRGQASRMSNVDFGEYGLQALESGRVSSRQIEASRRAIAHRLQRGGKVWIRIFPHFPLTSKGNEMPMGKGKGAVDRYVAIIHPGTVMFEVGGTTPELAKTALQLAGHKLSVRSQVIRRI